jgi:hypothetical protein
MRRDNRPSGESGIQASTWPPTSIRAKPARLLSNSANLSGAFDHLSPDPRTDFNGFGRDTHKRVDLPCPIEVDAPLNSRIRNEAYFQTGKRRPPSAFANLDSEALEWPM